MLYLSNGWSKTQRPKDLLIINILLDVKSMYHSRNRCFQMTTSVVGNASQLTLICVFDRLILPNLLRQTSISTSYVGMAQGAKRMGLAEAEVTRLVPHPHIRPRPKQPLPLLLLNPSRSPLSCRTLSGGRWRNIEPNLTPGSQPSTTSKL